jgi:hypothetical protein
VLIATTSASALSNIQYWFHRAFHRVPLLWGFHAVHPSAKAMDWLAGARMHFVEIILFRGVTSLPLLTVSFAPVVMQAYIAFVYAYASLVHANLRGDFDRLAISWSRRGFTTGTMRSRQKASTRISRSTFRCSTDCSERFISQPADGQAAMAFPNACRTDIVPSSFTPFAAAAMRPATLPTPK